MDNRNFSHESVKYQNSERFQPSSEMILEELDEVTKVFECGHPNVYSAYWMTLQQAEEAHLNTPIFFPVTTCLLCFSSSQNVLLAFTNTP